MAQRQIITATQLASYLLPMVVDEDAVVAKVQLANDLVIDVVGDLDPLPGGITAIALEAAARPVRAADYTSVTVTSDGTSKTSRREGNAATANGQAGVYLTKGETARLRALAGKPARRRPRSIRTYVP